MKLIFTVIFMLVLAAMAQAQPNYDVSLIPKELMPYASAVVRSEETSYEVKDLDNVIYHLKRVVTVLNKNGDEEGEIEVPYDKNTSVKYIKGMVYNEFGKPLTKFTEKNFSDRAAVDNSTLFADDRVKVYRSAIGGYPYTVEYEYELRCKFSLTIRDWMPINATNMAIEKSLYQFICKPNFVIRYKQLNLDGQVAITSNPEGLKVYTWQVLNKKALKSEPYSPSPRYFLPRVIVAPETFMYGNINGSFNNWEGMGKWINEKLLFKRGDIPAPTVAFLTELTKGITEPKLKAKKIYEYMQQKTHYISVQVGIGGYQPFLASEVDRTGYGDCKALVNYTKALLDAVGVESWYCIVNGNHDYKISFTADFATMSQANHVILCLPFKSDTTFLECTSQKIPFGFLSDFTDDRTVLACTPQGGKLMRTPAYSAQVNLQARKAGFTIDNNGMLTGSINTVFKGIQYDNREDMLDEPVSEQRKLFPKLYPAINNLDIENYNFKQDKQLLPSITEDIKLNARDFATTDNGKLYFSLNPLNRTGRAPRDVRNRVTPLYINQGYTDDDEITYKLPAGYKLEFNPMDIKLEKPFGKFTANMLVTGDKLVFKRYLQLKEGNYNKELYSELVDFYQKIADADNYNVSLVKN
jgi:hypothetical protein